MRSSDTEIRQNGHGVVPVPTEEWQRIDQAYRELQRRDGSAEQRAWRWERVALVVLGCWVLTLAVILWQFTHASCKWCRSMRKVSSCRSASRRTCSRTPRRRASGWTC